MTLKMVKNSLYFCMFLPFLVGCWEKTDQSKFIDEPQIKLIGTLEKVDQVVRQETFIQNNCGGTESVKKTLTGERSFQGIFEWGGDIEATAGGSIKIFGTGVDLGTKLATRLGYAYGTSETRSQSIEVSAAPGERMWYRIVHYETLDKGEVQVSYDGQSETVPFQFRRDFSLELDYSLDLGCDDTPHPTPTDLPPQTAIPTPQPTLAVDKEFTLDQYDVTFIYVPGGNFLMGSTETLIDEALTLCRQNQANCERDWFTDEIPQRLVFLEPFWIMETEVTNAQYSSFITAGGYTEKSFWSEEGWLWLLSQNVVQPAYWNDKLFSEDNQPVVGINWHEATAYANWLSGETNLIIRLPTEEEWEKAARGSAGLLFPWGNEWDGRRLNHQSDDNYSYSAPVGSYAMGMSPYGVLDMAGNVW